MVVRRIKKALFEILGDDSEVERINNNCIGCGKCVSICPMKNLILRNKKVVSNDRCTMCYRCISLCPQKAITLLGNEVVEQYRIEDYR